MITELYLKFTRKCFILRQRAAEIFSNKATLPPWKFKYLSSSLLLGTWQIWCFFCRFIILYSCRGSITRSGVQINPRLSDNTWQRISYEINQASQGKTIIPGKTIQYQRHEPTWGDTSVLLRAIPIISPSNAAGLIAGFGVSLNGPSRIQRVRNACSHLNNESMADIIQLTAYYTGREFKHPIDIIWWRDPLSGTDAYNSWIDDLELIAELVTN